MDAGIADTLNRRTARLIAENLDQLDKQWASVNGDPWPLAIIAHTFMGENASTPDDIRWYVGVVAAGTPGLDWDGEPADCDWGSLLSSLRAEILARRAPEAPHSAAAEIRPAEVV